MRVSIRRQLITLFMPFVFGLWIATAVVSFWLVSSFAGDSFDRDLISSADSIVGRLRVQNGKVTLDLPPAALAILKHNESDKFYYNVISLDGKRLIGDIDLPSPHAPLQADAPRVKTAKLGEKEIRIAKIRVGLKYDDGEDVIVQVAETTNVRKRFQEKMLLSIALPQLLVILLGLLAVWYGITKILTPLRLLQSQIASRSQSDLSAVHESDVAEEIYPLVQEINKLLARLREELKAHQRFIANAAHQLRTPLAGLKTYSSIGCDMTETKDLQHIVKELDTGIDRASRMVSQLLALARTDASEQGVNAKTQVDLNFIVSDVTAELVEQAVLKDLELVYEQSQEPAFIYGEQTGLRHMVTNLVENALMYTPHGGKVKVQVKNNGGVVLRVSDTGGGIPEEERVKIFERFYRVDGTAGSGSGLGLSIVKEVANFHSAKIAVEELPTGPGTLFIVEFPKNNNSKNTVN